ncbi:hypothetical protein [Spiroplasma endosymbiont of Polydrusus pterygomalis]|uniref:hypothetical protein n=1 Tax=Spiroplasma endosymbiont of Polydrusus pterygomalis TaxID=3139327 RepID=UPI003CCA99E6
MKENNIQAEYVKRMRRKILIKQNRNKNIIKYPDLVNRNFNDMYHVRWSGKKQLLLNKKGCFFICKPIIIN